MARSEVIWTIQCREDNEIFAAFTVKHELITALRGLMTPEWGERPDTVVVARLRDGFSLTNPDRNEVTYLSPEELLA